MSQADAATYFDNQRSSSLEVSRRIKIPSDWVPQREVENALSQQSPVGTSQNTASH
jgi:hypothetical protein